MDDAVRQALAVLGTARPANLTESRLVLFDATTLSIAERVRDAG
ncbi:hypothetical protein [Micromonospora sp. NPDC004704]